jgi:nucleotide-binding universal stress UspA family protein
MLNFTHILCPVDFFPASLRAASYAAALARNYGAKLDLLHVCTQSQSKSKEDMTAAAAALGSGIGTEIAEGDVVSAIRLAVSEHRTDLLVMGTHGRHGFERLLFGSTTEAILRSTRIPVLVVRGNEEHIGAPPPAIHRILITVDFSEGTTEELAYGLSIAQECQAEVTLLHIVDDLFGVDAGGNHFEKLIATRIREKLDNLVPSEVRNWCEVRSHIAAGVPADVILSILKSHNIDLLVMNIHPKASLERALLGSTAEHVVRASTCPVLLVPTLAWTPAHTLHQD